MELLNEYYGYVKALHYMAFVSWMAALFYLPRLFVYHAENKDNADFIKVIKLACAVLLLVYHFSCAHYRKQLESDTCTKSGVFFRVYNEVPTLLFAGIVFSFAIAGVL